MLKRKTLQIGVCGSFPILVAITSPLPAAEVGFTEEFAEGPSNWRDSNSINAPTWHAAGGPDGSAFVSTTFNFKNSTPQTFVALFRAQQEFGSSGGAFFGNWIADGVTEVSAFVRHDADRPLTQFGRFASPAGFPAMAGVAPSAIQPNVWTPITLALSPDALVAEGPSTFEGVFANLGRLQFGAAAAGLAGADRVVTFDLDRVSIVPEPSTIVLMGAGLLALGRAVRRRRETA